MKKKICSVLFVLIAAGLSLAQGTHQWKESSYDDFERGTAKGVSISSTGFLELAPAFKLLYTSPSTFIWSIAADKDGTVYAGTGSPGQVYRITADGKGSVIFEPKDLQVQAVAIGKDGALYAATSPDGKVYKITRAAKATPDAEFKSEVFFDAKTKYIWDLALDAEGRLYVATGDQGEIYRVEKNGQRKVFFKSDEAHIRVLAFDLKGNLIAGSDPSGLIYRISPAGDGFVLYSAPKKEITALAVDAAGNIFASGAGDKHPQGINLPMIPGQPPIPQPPALPPGAPAMPNAVALAGSDVYMIAPDGSPRKLWSSREDIVYALALDASGRLIAGTGNKGRVFAIDKDGAYVDLLKATATQVTAFAKAPDGSLYCSTSNLGKIFALSNSPEAEGTFDSDVQDAKIFSRWGRVEVRGRGNYEVYARSGNVDNPDRNWSPWTRVDLSKDSGPGIPAARFVQWRAVLKPAAPATVIDDFTINYLTRNVAPVVDELAVQTGARFQTQPRILQPENVIVNLGPNPAVVMPHIEAQPQAVRDRAYIALRWSAHDDNDDDLVYSVYYRGDNEQNWKLLKSGVTDKFYSFDSGLLPDGGYELKVVASDAPSHTAEEALSAEKVSSRFEIDNTPPRIQKLAARLEGRQLHVTFQATDDASAIKRAEYSIDAGDWQYLQPVDQISDSKTESYDFHAPLPAIQPADQSEPKHGHAAKSAPVASEHVVVVRVYDRADNVATAKYVVK